ncbi:MAG: Na+/H+ antiporter NhaC family protein [Clostridiales bacterium]|nr:Na+/H+ antiporter NhaC family protein [Candidatus Crickella merdequi]
MEKNIKPNGFALIPFLSFIVIYLGAGAILAAKGVEFAFYQFPAVVAILFATIVGFAIFKGTIDENFAIFAKGAGNPDIMCMLMIFLLAGGFSAVAKAMGGVDSTVNLGLSIIPAQYVTAGVFIIAAFLSFATGTSMGTVGAVTPIAIGLVDKAGLSMSLVMGACLCGALFGDNLSMISDTTISATRTQKVELKDKFRSNFGIAIPAALITVVLLLVFGAPETVVQVQQLDYSMIKVLPYLIVILCALVGMNVFLVLILGTVSAGAIGIALGDMTFLSFTQEIWNGFQGMIEVFLLSIFIGGIAEMTKEFGGIAWILEKIKKFLKGRKSAQCGNALFAGLCDVATANNTIAIITAGQVASDVSREYGVDPRKTASILDISACVVQGMLPYSAQFLTIVALSEGRVDPIGVIGHNWYLIILAICMVISFFIPKMDALLIKGKWNWDTNKAE